MRKRWSWCLGVPVFVAMLGCFHNTARDDAFKRELDALTYEMPCNELLEITSEVLQDRGTTVNHKNDLTLETPLFDVSSVHSNDDFVILAKFTVFARAPSPTQCQIVAEKKYANRSSTERAIDVELETLKRIDPDRHAQVLDIADKAGK